jgi:hypothetical protein
MAAMYALKRAIEAEFQWESNEAETPSSHYTGHHGSLTAHETASTAR